MTTNYHHMLKELALSVIVASLTKIRIGGGNVLNIIEKRAFLD